MMQIWNSGKNQLMNFHLLLSQEKINLRTLLRLIEMFMSHNLMLWDGAQNVYLYFCLITKNKHITG